NIASSSTRACLLPLSAASPDRCLQQVFHHRTTAGLFASMSSGTTNLLVLDALDTIQYTDVKRLGQISDLRLLLLLISAARRKWQGVSILVPSRFHPPRELQGEALSVIELAAIPQVSPAAPAGDAQSAALLEVLASSRQASSGWLLGALARPNETQP